MTTAYPEQPSIFHALKVRSFRRIWTVGMIGSIGDQVFPICATVLILKHGSGALAIAAVMSSRVVAFLLLAPIGGVWADRLPRIRVMQASALLRSLLCLGVFLSATLGNVNFIYLLVFLMGAAEAFSGPAAVAVVASLVKDSLILSANALRAMSARLTSIVGPGLAAPIILLIGARNGFLVTAGTFIFTFFGLFGIKDAPARMAERTPFFSELKIGWLEIKRRKWIYSVIVGLSLQTSILFGAEMVLLPVITNRVFGSSSVYPFAIASLSIGSLISAYLATKWKVERKGLVAFVSWSALIVLPLALIFPLSKEFVIICYFIGGLATQPMGVFWATALQQTISDDKRGRVTSLEATVTSALIPIGMMSAGPLSQYLGEKRYLTMTILIFLISILVTLRSKGVTRFSE